MALDRSWYNTLVDDDGSGMTGSVWDKADVDALMDAVDAEIARLDLSNITGWNNHTPTLGAAAGSWFGGTPLLQWRSVGQYSVEVIAAFEGTQFSGGPAQYLSFSLPFTALGVGSGPTAIIGHAYMPAGHEAVLIEIPPNGGAAQVARLGALTFSAVSPLYIRCQFTYRIKL